MRLHDLPGTDDTGAGRKRDGCGVDDEGRGRGGAGRAGDPRSGLALRRPWRNPHHAASRPGGAARREPEAAAAPSGAADGAAEGYGVRRSLCCAIQAFGPAKAGRRHRGRRPGPSSGK